MTNREKICVKNCIEEEGFDYCFYLYCEFEDIEDEEFHKLRNEYLKAREKLSAYLD